MVDKLCAAEQIFYASIFFVIVGIKPGAGMSIQLESVSIENYRSIKKCTLLLSAYTPIVGYNNSGKSNVISAIQWLLRRSLLVTKEFNDPLQPVEVIGNVTGVSATIVASMPETQQKQIRPYISADALTIKRRQENPNAKSSEVVLWVWNPTASSWERNPTGIDNALSAILPDPIRIGAMEDAADDASKSRSTTTIGKLLGEFIAPVKAAHQTELAAFLLEISRRVSADGDRRFAELLKIDDEISHKIDELFPGIGAKLHFPVPAFEDLIKAGTLRLQEGTGEHRDFTAYGHGTQRSVQMTLVRHLADVRRGAGPAGGTTLLLIDEPELYLHPFAVEHIRAALKSLGNNGYQVIFSTHSAQMVPPVDAQYALLIRKDVARGTNVRERLRTAIQTIVPNSMHAMEQLFTLGNSSKILFADRVILTEGKTELRLLPGIYESMNTRSLGQDRCALVAQSGANDTKKSMQILAAMDIPCRAVVDLDFVLKGAVRDGFLTDTDSDLATLKTELATLQADGKITLGKEGLPANGIVSASAACMLLAEQALAKPAIAALHLKLKAQNIWLWQLGDIEAHIGLTAKSEHEWAKFNLELTEHGFRKACKHAESVEDMFRWAVAA